MTEHVRIMINAADHFSKASTISKEQAIHIARKFLSQHHNVSNAEAVLKGNKWIVTVCVGMSSDDTRRVEIDANSGKLLGCT